MVAGMPVLERRLSSSILRFQKPGALRIEVDRIAVFPVKGRRREEEVLGGGEGGGGGGPATELLQIDAAQALRTGASRGRCSA